MPAYKLIYFNFRGRAEAIRMLFALAGQDYEDYRFKEGEFAKTKGNTETFPMGQVPVLLIDGKPMPQSRAICQYLAREFGLYGKDNAEATKIDIISDTVGDLFNQLIPIFFEKDETKKAALKTKYKEEDSKRQLAFLNKFIKEAGGRFFVGSKETAADVTVYTMMDMVGSLVGATFIPETYPELGKFHKEFTDNSKLSDYIKNRPA